MDLTPNIANPENPVSEADFIRLHSKHGLALRNYARLMMPDWNGVDDVLQEASVTMWEKRGQLRSEEGFLPWGKVIVRNKCFNAISKMRRDRLVLDEKVLGLVAEEEEADKDGFDAKGVQEVLEGCLQKLPKDRRELVLAPYHGSGEVTRLAEEKRKTPNALYKIIGRIRVKLSECVESSLRLEMS